MVAGLISRIVAAVFGGYGLAALFSVAILAVPFSKPEAVLAGMTASFIVYVAAVIWVFLAPTASRAWMGLILAGLALMPFAWYVWREGNGVL
jgi:hypothetical protein